MNAVIKLRELIRRGLNTADGGAELAVSGDWMTVQEAADALGLSTPRVHHLLSVGYLESCKAEDGWRRLVSAESVRAELDRRERARLGIRPPYADAASTYRAEAARRGAR